jgi:hypothetical protein
MGVFHSVGVPRKQHHITRGGTPHTLRGSQAAKGQQWGNEDRERQRGRGDTPNDPAPIEGVLECFTQQEYPENCVASRGAAPLPPRQGGWGKDKEPENEDK